LYFIYDEDEDYAELYLGSKLISNPELSSGSGAKILNDLEDVFINENIATDHLLIYDSYTDTWTNKHLDEIIGVYLGPTSVSAGIAGLVPGAPANQYDLFLRSDGTWASIEGQSRLIFNIENRLKIDRNELIATET
jgi:hypothetical protein